jgi:lipocalin
MGRHSRQGIHRGGFEQHEAQGAVLLAFKGDYYILALADDYSYALVGHPNRDYLWVLSRSAIMDDGVYQQLLAKAAELGFDTARLVRTPMDC